MIIAYLVKWIIIWAVALERGLSLVHGIWGGGKTHTAGDIMIAIQIIKWLINIVCLCYVLIGFIFK